MCEVDVQVDKEIFDGAEKKMNGEITKVEDGQMVVDKRSWSKEEEEKEEEEEGKEWF